MDSEKLNWMYAGPAGHVNSEEYLMGRSVDKTFEQFKLGGAEPIDLDLPPPTLPRQKSSVPAVQVDVARKVQEDPLLRIKLQAEEKKAALLEQMLIKQRLAEQMKKKKDQQSKKNESKKSKKKKKKRKKESSDSSDSDLDAKLARQLKKLKKPAPQEESDLDLQLAKQLKKIRESKQQNDSSDSSSSSSGSDSSESEDEARKESRSHKRRDVETSRPRDRSSRDREIRPSAKDAKHSRPERDARHVEKSSHDRGTRTSHRSSRDDDFRRHSRSSPDREHRGSSRTSRDHEHRRSDRPSRERDDRHGSRSGDSRRSRSPLSRNRSFDARKRHAESRPQERPRPAPPGANRKPATVKLSEEELEKRRQEMMAQAVVRDQERKEKVDQYRKEVAAEEEQLNADRPKEAAFVKDQLARAVGNSTVESRIKANVFNIQRSGKAMDSNFARR